MLPILFRRLPAHSARAFSDTYRAHVFRCPYSFTIGFVGAILFLLVDKYEPEGPLARLLKFLILFVAGVATLHKLQPYGLALF